MTVAELIAKLEQMPLTADVWVQGPNHYEYQYMGRLQDVTLDFAGDVMLEGGS